MAVRTLDTWRDRAACRGPETALFFPPATTERREVRDARERRAKAICRDTRYSTSASTTPWASVKRTASGAV